MKIAAASYLSMGRAASLRGPPEPSSSAGLGFWLPLFIPLNVGLVTYFQSATSPLRGGGGGAAVVGGGRERGKGV